MIDPATGEQTIDRHTVRASAIAAVLRAQTGHAPALDCYVEGLANLGLVELQNPNVPEAVRVVYRSQWLAAGGEDLSASDHPLAGMF